MASGLAAALLLLPTMDAQADPTPTIAEAKAKLKKLNEQADQVVDRYNAATERWKKAKKQYDAVNNDYRKHAARVESLRGGVVSMAVSNYLFGDFAWSGVVYGSDPESALSGMAAFDQLSQERAKKLDEYEKAASDLKRRRKQRKAAYDQAVKVRADLAKEKEQVEKLVAQQMRLLRELGTYNPGNPNSQGMVYTGPASGNARIALAFAYKQIGKPYRYGGTGPGGWDCSGLTRAAWAAAGVRLPRTSYEQWAWGAGRRVSLNELQPGDLVWHSGYGHVGLYAGDGKVVHAPQTGDVVKVVSLSEYRPIGAVRP